mmetsp:Transcript_10830/g.32620  ORF Transcript_10830/g.32620 Transcript_10830/m.32620 type:complete len:204 (+) Transcript_10830:305-916(+)
MPVVGDALDEVRSDDLPAVLQPEASTQLLRLIDAQVDALHRPLAVARMPLQESQQLILVREGALCHARGDRYAQAFQPPIPLASAAESPASLVVDVEGHKVARELGVGHAVASPRPLAEKHLHLRLQELADRPAVLVPPCVEGLPLRGGGAGHIVRPVLEAGLVGLRQGDTAVCSVDLLLDDDGRAAVEEARRFEGLQQPVAL